MKKIFVDTDVILDFLLDRDLFSEEVALLIDKSLMKEIVISVSSLTISNLYYIISRIENKKSASFKIEKILKLVKVENVGQTTVQKAAESDFSDFEDGIQNFCAEEAGLKIIVTRNTKDYKCSNLAIMSPREYVAKL